MFAYSKAFVFGLALAAATAWLPGAATAQDVDQVTVRGLTISLTERDKRWLRSYCEERGFGEGSEDYRECLNDKAREILDQRARDATYRPNAP